MVMLQMSAIRPIGKGVLRLNRWVYTCKFYVTVYM
jgi:hypothetical protein